MVMADMDMVFLLRRKYIVKRYSARLHLFQKDKAIS